MKIIRLFIFTLILAACASSPKEEAAPTPPENAVSTEAGPLPSAATVAAALKPPTEVATPVAAAKTVETKSAAPKGVEPQQALRWLQNGNTRFVKGFLRKDGQSKKDIGRLVSGQQPHSVVIACSDSRVPPEIVFDQKLGEIFVVRTAGEAMDDNVIGSVEYAVEKLGARMVLVLGHTYCGAIEAALKIPPGGDAGSAALTHIVASIQPHLQGMSSKNEKPSGDVARESMANAQGVVADLKRLSPILKAAVEKGQIEIRPALYHLNSGAVSFE